jgi:multicomponent Na+:H+ antiporter subunit D
LPGVSPAWQRGFALAGSIVLTGGSLLLLRHGAKREFWPEQIGNWSGPFGITLVADLFSAIMVVLTGLVGPGTAVYSLFSVDRPASRSAITRCFKYC